MNRMLATYSVESPTRTLSLYFSGNPPLSLMASELNMLRMPAQAPPVVAPAQSYTPVPPPTIGKRRLRTASACGPPPAKEVPGP